VPANAKTKLGEKETKTQRDESQDKELENAISKISNSNKDGSNTLKTYKKNSTFLMWSGIGFSFNLSISVCLSS
jgi:Zn-dependent M28 family amino/carboxypeptidase